MAEVAPDPVGSFVGISGRNLTYNGASVVLKGTNFDNNPALALGPPGTASAIAKINVINDDYQTLSAWGGNVVRFGMDYNWYRTNSAGFFAVMDQHLQYARSNRLWMIPTLFVPPGGTTGGYQQNCLWSDCPDSAPNRQALQDFWVAFAQKYKNETIIAAYDLVNDPNPPADSEWVILGQTLRDAITAVDGNHLVMFEAGPNGLFTAGPLSGSNILYSDHHNAPASFVANSTTGCVYPGTCEGRSWDKDMMMQYIQNGEFIDYNFSVARNVPLLVGEFGAITVNTDYAQYDADQADIFAALGLSWTYHTWRQASSFATFPCPTGGDMTCGDPGLVEVMKLKLAGSVQPPDPPPSGSPVQLENLNAGSTAWQLTLVADDQNKQVKGYASATSLAVGDTLNFSVTVNPVQSYTIDVFRMGWYGGSGGRLMSHVGPLDGVSQPACPIDTNLGLIACQWSVGYSLNVPMDWVSGIYLALLTNAAGYQNYVPFVVKDGRQASYLYQSSVTTYQAYNDYPDDNATGKSLYDYNSFGPPTMAGTTRAVKVSFDRPYAGDGSGQFFDNEQAFVTWAERQGYDITYSTDIDTHASGARLLQNRSFLSVGHDEYWSKEMFDAAAAARDAGVNLAFFGGNDAFWQVRFEPGASGVANRVMVCYKDSTLDPVQGPTTTVNFRAQPVNRPEQTLIGVMFSGDGNYGTDVAYTVDQPGHWIFNGLGLNQGDSIPNIVGYEVDSYLAAFPLPAANSYTILSKSPFNSNDAGTVTANSSMYQAPSGAWVFGAGTIDWCHGLDFATGDDRARQITGNILDQFGLGPGQGSGSIGRVQAGSLVKSYSADVTVTLPASSQPGTLLVATLGADGSNGFSGPAGWVQAVNASSASVTAAVWYYPNNPGGITAATFTATGSPATAGTLSEWSGAAQGSPVDGTGSVTAGSTNSVTASTGSPASGNLVVTSFSPFLVNGGALTFTGGAGYTALARDPSLDWFHFDADYSLGMSAGVMAEMASTQTAVNWSGVIVSFKSS